MLEKSTLVFQCFSQPGFERHEPMPPYFHVWKAQVSTGEMVLWIAPSNSSSSEVIGESVYC